jgi:hypothetical protein
MLSGHRSARRRGGRKSRAARIAVPLAIPMALGLTLGIILAVSGGRVTAINQSALGDCGATPAASASAAAATASTAATTASPAATPSPCPTTSTSATASGTTLTAPSFATGQTAFRPLGDLANAPVNGAAGAAPISLDQTAAEAANSMNCTLLVPNNPLSTQGLETPYQLGDGCTMANSANVGAFVEATILSPNGQIQVYNPLVVTAGTTPAAPVAPAPTIQRGDEVEISIGFNGNNLVDIGRGAYQGGCIDALGESLIGQVSACNAVAFYNMANAEIARGILEVPALGTDDGGQTCLDTRNFALIDQDQSDNTVSQYLLNANGQTEQDTPANAATAAANGFTQINNGSDDTLLGDFVDPANGCTSFQATDTTNPNGKSDSQATNELSSRVNQTTDPIADMPVNDEMTLVDGNFSVAKTNVYRSLVDQPLLPNNVNANEVAADYCQNMVNIAPERNQEDMARELNNPGPVPAEGVNLAAFMGERLSVSFMVLNCQNFGLTNPVNATLNGAGSATAVTYNLAQQTATIPGATATPSPSASGGAPGGAPAPSAWPSHPAGSVTTRGRRGHWQNPTGM